MTPWIAAHQASLSITNSQSLFKLMSIDLVMLSNHLILCYPSSSCPKCFPASESFPVSWLFASGGQKIGASASVSVLPVNIQIVFIFTQGSFLVPRSHSGFHAMFSHICRFEPAVFEPPVFLVPHSRPLAFPFCRATPALYQVTINLLWSIRKKPSPKIPSSSN